MDKNILLTFRQLQSVVTRFQLGNCKARIIDGTLTSNAIDISQTSGIIQIQISHASAGAATVTGEILESVDGVTFVENGTGFGDTIAKATPTIYSHDAKANRFIKIKITEDDVAATVVTLSVAIR